jgi:Raf kinase inhibitor-like YbhB/YbcL family protein
VAFAGYGRGMRKNASSIFVVLLMGALAACGDDDAPKADAAGSNGPDAAVVDAAPGTPDAPPANEADAEVAEFALTSTAFNATDLLADKYTCAGANVSPPMSWTAGPSGTLSYAIVFRDNDNGLVHAVIWDIPADAHAVPEHVERVAMPSVPAGAKQAKAYDGVFGYAGPCPNGHTHHYEFELYALDVSTMPGLTSTTSKDAVAAALDGGHKLASTKLSLISDAAN